MDRTLPQSLTIHKPDLREREARGPQTRVQQPVMTGGTGPFPKASRNKSRDGRDAAGWQAPQETTGLRGLRHKALGRRAGWRALTPIS